jgi:hypothetical protein
MVTSFQAETEQEDKALMSFAVRIYQQNETRPNSIEVEWTVYWELTWDMVPGAIDYLIYYITSEGGSTRPRISSEPRWRLSIARGIGDMNDNQADWQALTGLMGAQLQVMVKARFVDGSTGAPSPSFPVGEPLYIAS